MLREYRVPKDISIFSLKIILYEIRTNNSKDVSNFLSTMPLSLESRCATTYG